MYSSIENEDDGVNLQRSSILKPSKHKKNREPLQDLDFRLNSDADGFYNNHSYTRRVSFHRAVQTKEFCREEAVTANCRTYLETFKNSDSSSHQTDSSSSLSAFSFTFSLKSAATANFGDLEEQRQCEDSVFLYNCKEEENNYGLDTCDQSNDMEFTESIDAYNYNAHHRGNELSSNIDITESSTYHINLIEKNCVSSNMFPEFQSHIEPKNKAIENNRSVASNASLNILNSKFTLEEPVEIKNKETTYLLSKDMPFNKVSNFKLQNSVQNKSVDVNSNQRRKIMAHSLINKNISHSDIALNNQNINESSELNESLQLTNPIKRPTFFNSGEGEMFRAFIPQKYECDMISSFGKNVACALSSVDCSSNNIHNLEFTKEMEPKDGKRNKSIAKANDHMEFSESDKNRFLSCSDYFGEEVIPESTEVPKYSCTVGRVGNVNSISSGSSKNPELRFDISDKCISHAVETTMDLTNTLTIAPIFRPSNATTHINDSPIPLKQGETDCFVMVNPMTLDVSSEEERKILVPTFTKKCDSMKVSSKMKERQILIPSSNESDDMELSGTLTATQSLMPTFSNKSDCIKLKSTLNEKQTLFPTFSNSSDNMKLSRTINERKDFIPSFFKESDNMELTSTLKGTPTSVHTSSTECENMKLTNTLKDTQSLVPTFLNESEGMELTSTLKERQILIPTVSKKSDIELMSSLEGTQTSMHTFSKECDSIELARTLNEKQMFMNTSKKNNNIDLMDTTVEQQTLLPAFSKSSDNMNLPSTIDEKRDFISAFYGESDNMELTSTLKNIRTSVSTCSKEGDSVKLSTEKEKQSLIFFSAEYENTEVTNTLKDAQSLMPTFLNESEGMELTSTLRERQILIPTFSKKSNTELMSSLEGTQTSMHTFSKECDSNELARTLNEKQMFMNTSEKNNNIELTGTTMERQTRLPTFSKSSDNINLLSTIDERKDFISAFYEESDNMELTSTLKNIQTSMPTCSKEGDNVKLSTEREKQSLISFSTECENTELTDTLKNAQSLMPTFLNESEGMELTSALKERQILFPTFSKKSSIELMSSLEGTQTSMDTFSKECDSSELARTLNEKQMFMNNSIELTGTTVKQQTWLPTFSKSSDNMNLLSTIDERKDFIPAVCGENDNIELIRTLKDTPNLVPIFSKDRDNMELGTVNETHSLISSTECENTKLTSTFKDTNSLISAFSNQSDSIKSTSTFKEGRFFMLASNESGSMELSSTLKGRQTLMPIFSKSDENEEISTFRNRESLINYSSNIDNMELTLKEKHRSETTCSAIQGNLGESYQKESNSNVLSNTINRCEVPLSESALTHGGVLKNIRPMNCNELLSRSGNDTTTELTSVLLNFSPITEKSTSDIRSSMKITSQVNQQTSFHSVNMSSELRLPIKTIPMSEDVIEMSTSCKNNSNMKQNGNSEDITNSLPEVSNMELITRKKVDGVTYATNKLVDLDLATSMNKVIKEVSNETDMNSTRSLNVSLESCEDTQQIPTNDSSVLRLNDKKILMTSHKEMIKNVQICRQESDNMKEDQIVNRILMKSGIPYGSVTPHNIPMKVVLNAKNGCITESNMQENSLLNVRSLHNIEQNASYDCTNLNESHEIPLEEKNPEMLCEDNSIINLDPKEKLDNLQLKNSTSLLDEMNLSDIEDLSVSDLSCKQYKLLGEMSSSDTEDFSSVSDSPCKQLMESIKNANKSIKEIMSISNAQHTFSNHSAHCLANNDNEGSILASEVHVISEKCKVKSITDADTSFKNEHLIIDNKNEVVTREATRNFSQENMEKVTMLQESDTITNGSFMKPSIEEQIREQELRSGCVWRICDFSAEMWIFEYLDRSLKLFVKLVPCHIKPVTDIYLLSNVSENTDPILKLMHYILQSTFNEQTLKSICKSVEDIMKVLEALSNEVNKLNEFARDLFYLDMMEMAKIESNCLSYIVADMDSHVMFHVCVNLSKWEDVSPADVSVETLIGNVREQEIKQLVTGAARGPKCLKHY
ncbi:serine-rich adhesin for platelets-like isoform X2 [Periplaneta americana]